MGICDKVGFERRIPIPFAYSQKVFSFRVGMLTISSRKRFFVFMNCVSAMLLHFLHKNLPIFAQKQAWRKPSKNSCTNSPRFYLLGKLVSTTSHQKLVKTHREYLVQLYTTTIVQKHPRTQATTLLHTIHPFLWAVKM